MKNILILFGGVSPEHEISIRSVKSIIQHIDIDLYNIILVGIGKEKGKWIHVDEKNIPDHIDESSDKNIYIEFGKKDFVRSRDKNFGEIDLVFPVLHGSNGEDGAIQGFLELIGVPYVGTGVLGSAVTMDKDFTKIILREKEIDVVDWRIVKIGEDIPSYENFCGKLSSKILYVKPSNMGSSVGVNKVNSEYGWKNALKEGFKYDQKLLIEPEIIGRELECAILGNLDVKASTIGEVGLGKFYDFHEKYSNQSQAKIIIPANLSDKLVEKVQKIAIKAYKAVECRGFSRVDFFLTEDQKLYVNEINSIPGFTSQSMYPKLWEKSGLNYTNLLNQLFDLAIYWKNKKG